MFKKMVAMSVVKKVAVLLVGVVGVGSFISGNKSEQASLQSNAPTSSTVQPISEVKSAVIDKKITTQTISIPYKSTTTNDVSLASGTTKIKTQGQNGVQTDTYEVTYNDGKETGRILMGSTVTTQPIEEVVAVGTYVAPKPVAAPKPVSIPAPATATTNCNENYSGCVPIDSDVDCQGGSGNGPSYVQGPVTVIGTDIYGLDRDGDGLGCE